jgi:hypothetical protein
MKRLLPLAICCLLAATAHAQRGGMRGGGGGMGGFRGGAGGGIHTGGSPIRGGGFSGGGFRGGFGNGGFGGFNRGFGYGRTTSGWFGFGWGGYGYPYSYGYWPSYPYYGYSYLSGYPYSSLGGYGYPVDSGYSYGYSQPAVTVVYGPQQPQYMAPAEPERARPVTREYDEYGQEVRPQSSSSSPIYLFAFKDQSIHAAASYWVANDSLHYITLQHEEKTAPLDTLDRALTLQLNRERRVSVRIP